VPRRETFEYMADASGGGVAQTVRVVSYGEGEIWPNRHDFCSSRKSLIHSSSCSIFGICGGRGGWLKTSHGGRGLAENVRIPSYGGVGLKLLKNRRMIFERPRGFDAGSREVESDPAVDNLKRCKKNSPSELFCVDQRTK